MTFHLSAISTRRFALAGAAVRGRNQRLNAQGVAGQFVIRLAVETGIGGDGRSYWSQCRDLRLLALTHNVLILVIIKVFYRAGQTPFSSPSILNTGNPKVKSELTTWSSPDILTPSATRATLRKTTCPWIRSGTPTCIRMPNCQATHYCWTGRSYLELMRTSTLRQLGACPQLRTSISMIISVSSTGWRRDSSKRSSVDNSNAP